MTAELLKIAMETSRFVFESPLQARGLEETFVNGKGIGAFYMYFDNKLALLENRPYVELSPEGDFLPFMTLAGFIKYGILSADQLKQISSHDPRKECIVVARCERSVMLKIRKQHILDTAGPSVWKYKYFYRCCCGSTRDLVCCSVCGVYFECSAHKGTHVCLPHTTVVRRKLFKRFCGSKDTGDSKSSIKRSVERVKIEYSLQRAKQAVVDARVNLAKYL